MSTVPATAAPHFDVSERIRSVQPPVIPMVGDLMRAHPGTISLGQGVVYYDPPESIADGVAAFLRSPANHRYQGFAGIPALREAIFAKLETENHIDPGRWDLVVTAGSNMGFFNAVLAICDPGDEVILLTPWYFNHEMAIGIAGCRTVPVVTGADFQPDVDRIARHVTPRTRAVVTISPNNPTGAVYDRDTLDTVNDLCRERGLYHIHDEAYEYFVYDGASHYSPASRSGSEDHTISLFSLSKAFSLASWRIGYMVLPPHLVESVRKIQDTNVICPPVISQFAAVEAMRLGRAYCEPMIKRIAEVREYLYGRLARVPGVRVNAARGAFYVFLGLPDAGRDDLEVVRALIADHGVAAIPGSAFGIGPGCYLRVSYGALDPDTARQGIDRLCIGLAALAAG